MAAIIIYSKQQCPYCVRAKNLLERKGVKEWEEVRIDQEPERRDEMIKKSGGRMTVPQIFIGDIHVGGYDDLEALNNKGELDALIA